MQLMTFNSLLMFDIVFVFFLFLVAVTCLVYYLPTGKQPVPSSENQCRHHRHYYYHNPNHRHHQPHPQGGPETGRYQGSIKQEQNNLQGRNLIESENGQLCEHHQILDEAPPAPPGHKLPPCCHHHLHYSCPCELSNCENYFCGVDLDPTGAQLASVEAAPAPRLSAVEAAATGLQMYRAPSSDCCLEDSDDNESIFCGEPHGFSALSADLTEHFVVVNETERTLPTPHCCYVKAKFANDKDCVGPIADV